MFRNLRLQRLESAYVLILVFLTLAWLASCQPLPPINPTPNLPATTSPSATSVSLTPVTIISTLTATIEVPAPSSTPVVTVASPVGSSGLVPLAMSGTGTFQGSLDYSPDANLLAVPASMGVDLYQARTFSKIRTISTGEVHFVAFSPDGQILGTDGSEPGEVSSQVVQLWRVADGTLLRKISAGNLPGNALDDLAFSPDSHLVAAAFWEDHTVHVWRVVDGELLYKLQGDRFDFSPDSKWVVVSTDSGDLKVSVNGTIDGVPVHHWDGQRAGFTPDGQLWVENLGAVRIMDLNSGRAAFAFSGAQVTFSADGQTLAVFENGVVKLYSAKTGILLQTLESSYLNALQLSAGYEVPMYFSQALQFQFAPDGETVAGLMVVRQCDNCQTVGSVIVRWRVSDGKIVDVLDDPEFTTTSWFTYSPDGGLLVLSLVDENVMLWSVPDLNK